jgi:hypothetical protein
VSAIATWCVLGDSTADNEHANPFMRFIAAFEYVQAHGFPDAGTPSADVLSSLDRAYGAMPFREVLEHSQEMGKEVAAQFFDMAAEDASGSSFLLGIAQSYGLLLASHLYMVDLFLEDPDGYCRPTAYLDRTLDALPEPPMRHTFGRPFHAVPKESLAGLASYSLFEGSEEADEPALRECVVTLPKNGIDLQVADNWQYLCGRIDAVFADFNRDSPEVEIAKRSALDRGARYFEVLV